MRSRTDHERWFQSSRGIHERGGLQGVRITVCFKPEQDVHTPCSVVDSNRLVEGALFPIPITLDVSREDIDRLSIAPGLRIALRDPRDDEALAIITGMHIMSHIVLYELISAIHSRRCLPS